MTVAAALSLAACGGGGSSKAESSPSTGADNTNVTTSTLAGNGGNGQCFQQPGPQKARVRFVNLYTNDTYPEGDIDVLQGFSGTDACAKKLATVPFGTASDYIDVTASDESGNWNTTGFVAGSTDDDHKIITQSETWKGGEQVTIVFMGQDPTSGNGPAAGADQTIFELPTPSEINTTLNSVPGKALLLVGAASLQYVVEDGAWVAGVEGGSGCVVAIGDSEGSTTNIGGTSLVGYAVDPGSIQLSLYPSTPGKCTGTPDIGPATIDGAADSRTIVLAYGSDPADLKLLVLPVA